MLQVSLKYIFAFDVCEKKRDAGDLVYVWAARTQPVPLNDGPMAVKSLSRNTDWFGPLLLCFRAVGSRRSFCLAGDSAHPSEAAEGWWLLRVYVRLKTPSLGRKKSAALQTSSRLNASSRQLLRRRVLVFSSWKRTRFFFFSFLLFCVRVFLKHTS